MSLPLATEVTLTKEQLANWRDLIGWRTSCVMTDLEVQHKRDAFAVAIEAANNAIRTPAPTTEELKAL
jgi:hypothetical protein